MKSFRETSACLSIRHVFAILLACVALLFGPTIAVDAATPYPGYTFYASGSTAYLVDMTGRTVHTWTASSSAQTCAYLLADGSALFPINNTACTSPSHNGAWPSGRFQKISWDGVITWDYLLCDSTARCGYDLEPMPNGNLLVPADSSTLGKIFEIQPSGATGGSVIWSCTLPTNITASTTYINSVSYNPELNKILVDLQDPQRRLVVIDHATGNTDFTYAVGASGQRVHAAAWVTKYFIGTTNIPAGADFAAMRTNNLLVIYNGGTCAYEVSIAASNIVKTFNWATITTHEGSVQRLPNGNTLLSSGNTTSIAELDDSGNVIATITAKGSMDRAYRYGYDFAGVSRLVTNVLTVVSPAGSPNPSGVTTNANGAFVICSVNSAVTNVADSLFVNTGWNLSGGKATNGATSGTTNNLVICMTNNPTLTWLWKSNFWLATATNGSGALNYSGGAPGWNPSTNSVTITAAAAANWHFVEWSGSTNGCAIAGAQITATMAQARTIAGMFAADSVAPPAAVRLSLDWIPADGTISIGATTLSLGATVSLQHATSLPASNWDTDFSFVATSAVTNWTLPVSSSNVFYRLQFQ